MDLTLPVTSASFHASALESAPRMASTDELWAGTTLLLGIINRVFNAAALEARRHDRFVCVDSDGTLGLDVNA